MSDSPDLNGPPEVTSGRFGDGEWHLTGGKHYLLYTETAVEAEDREDSPTVRIKNDAVDEVRTTIMVDLENRKATVIRHGAVEWNQTFQEGARHAAPLRAQGLSLPTDVLTHLMDFQLSAEGGALTLDYTLTIVDLQTRVRFRLEFAVKSG